MLEGDQDSTNKLHTTKPVSWVTVLCVILSEPDKQQALTTNNNCFTLSIPDDDWVLCCRHCREVPHVHITGQARDLGDQTEQSGSGDSSQ